MNKLFTQIQRLYFHPSRDDATVDASLQLPAEDGLTRAMVLRFKRSADWPAIAKLYEALQAELDLPAPAVSVSPRDGFQVWLSLAEPVPVAQAKEFLAALRDAYLGDLTHGGLVCFPPDKEGQESAVVALVPALDAASGRWSAFIDPSMGSVFVDELGLEMAPNFDRQAQSLGQLQSIRLADFERVLREMNKGENKDNSASTEQTGTGSSYSGYGYDRSDPRSFLLSVMNDPAVPTKQRIKAAKALLS